MLKLQTSILTGKIQPLEEITVAKSKGSLRAQIIAEEEIRFGEEIEAEEVVEEGDVIEGRRTR